MRHHLRWARSWPWVIAALLAVSVVFAGVASGALLPPRNPAHSLTLDEHVRTDCTGVHDQSATCIDESVAVLNAGRRNEGLGPLLLPRNWARLRIPEQIFVLTELERTARGLQPDTGLAADWNAAAQAGANASVDPTRAGSGAGGFLSIWAGGEPNPIIAMTDWIYDDAFFPDHTTYNPPCASNQSECWGHRDAILHDSDATACGRRCAVGAGYSPTGFDLIGAGQNRESYAEVFGVDAANNPDPLMFRWTSELRQLPACERVHDSCSWAGRPLMTATGMMNVRGLAQHASLVAPWFRSNLSWRFTSDAFITVSISVAITLRNMTVTAAQGGSQVYLTVHRRAADLFVATGQLEPGVWTLHFGYGTPAVDGPAPAWSTTVRVP
jgi:hypothetical protein